MRWAGEKDSWWQLGEGTGNQGGDLALYQIRCAFCEERGNFERVFHAEKKKPDSDKRLNFDVYRCANCSGYVHVLWSASELGGGIHAYRALPWPIGPPEPSKNWPTGVGRYWAQPHRSVSTESWDAAAVMARSALQVALREKGAQGRTLKAEIDDLAAKGLLPPMIREWATEIRLVANEAAHPDTEAEQLSPLDVRDAVRFLDFTLTILYDLPKEIEEYRARRQ